MVNKGIKQILCMKWGTRYGAKYVNNIYGMVARNISPPFQVICFTDNPEGIRDEVVCYDLPPLGCDAPTNAPGKWRKAGLWNRDLFGLTGVGLFVDLDVVITGNLDPFFSFGAPEDVILARNWVKPLERLGQTSIFRFPLGQHSYMLDELQKDPEGIAGKYQFEQRYVTQRISGGVKFWPSGWVKHFRLNCLGPWPLRYLRPPRLPAGTKVVIFPGKPDPVDARLGRWSNQVTPKPAWQHIRDSLQLPPGRRWKSIKRYVRPCRWIDENWRE